MGPAFCIERRRVDRLGRETSGAPHPQLGSPYEYLRHLRLVLHAAVDAGERLLRASFRRDHVYIDFSGERESVRRNRDESSGFEDRTE